MANISFVHARDHADVLFVGTLDWEAAHELVTTLETVFDHYFYRQVELLVSSPGGDTRALAYYLNAVRNWSNKGIRFRTRVISTAASAGAFMVSLGDERVAEGAGATARTSPPLRSCGTTRRRRSSSARPIRRRGTVSTTSVRTALDWRASFVCVPCPRCRLGNAMQRSRTVGSNGASSSRSTWRARANSIPRTRSRSFSTPPPRNSSAMARGRERAGPSLFVRRLPEPALAEHPDSLALARSSCLFVPGACTSVYPCGCRFRSRRQRLRCRRHPLLRRRPGRLLDSRLQVPSRERTGALPSGRGGRPPRGNRAQVARLHPRRSHRAGTQPQKHRAPSGGRSDLRSGGTRPPHSPDSERHLPAPRPLLRAPGCAATPRVASPPHPVREDQPLDRIDPNTPHVPGNNTAPRSRTHPRQQTPTRRRRIPPWNWRERCNATTHATHIPGPTTNVRAYTWGRNREYALHALLRCTQPNPTT